MCIAADCRPNSCSARLSSIPGSAFFSRRPCSAREARPRAWDRTSFRGSDVNRQKPSERPKTVLTPQSVQKRRIHFLKRLKVSSALLNAETSYPLAQPRGARQQANSGKRCPCAVLFARCWHLHALCSSRGGLARRVRRGENTKHGNNLKR